MITLLVLLVYSYTEKLLEYWCITKKYISPCATKRCWHKQLLHHGYKTMFLNHSNKYINNYDKDNHFVKIKTIEYEKLRVGQFTDFLLMTICPIYHIYLVKLKTCLKIINHCIY